MLAGLVSWRSYAINDTCLLFRTLQERLHAATHVPTTRQTGVTGGNSMSARDVSSTRMNADSSGSQRLPLGACAHLDGVDAEQASESDCSSTNMEAGSHEVGSLGHSSTSARVQQLNWLIGLENSGGGMQAGLEQVSAESR